MQFNRANFACFFAAMFFLFLIKFKKEIGIRPQFDRSENNKTPSNDTKDGDEFRA